MKQFLIIGNKNAISYKDVFRYIKDGTVSIGYTTPKGFIQPEGDEARTVDGMAKWLTSLPVFKEPLKLTEHYDPERYPKYDNYDAIDVSKTKDIPTDYNGVMGVPVSFLDKYDGDQFEIVTMAAGNSWVNYREDLEALHFNPDIKYGGGLGAPVLNGRARYSRIMIKKV